MVVAITEKTTNLWMNHCHSNWKNFTVHSIDSEYGRVPELEMLRTGGIRFPSHKMHHMSCIYQVDCVAMTHWWRQMSLCCHHSTRCCRASVPAVKISSCVQRSLTKTNGGPGVKRSRVQRVEKTATTKTWINCGVEVTGWRLLWLRKTQDITEASGQRPL